MGEGVIVFIGWVGFCVGSRSGFGMIFFFARESVVTFCGTILVMGSRLVILIAGFGPAVMLRVLLQLPSPQLFSAKILKYTAVFMGNA